MLLTLESLESQTCWTCNGSEHTECDRCRGEGQFPCNCTAEERKHTHDCFVCNASGEIRCVTCKGEGRLSPELNIVISDEVVEALRAAGLLDEDGELDDKSMIRQATEGEDGADPVSIEE